MSTKYRIRDDRSRSNRMEIAMSNFKIELFKELIKEISIKRYSQKQFAEIVENIYGEINKGKM